MTKLMLVEDDNNLREIYEARLQAEGYVIVSARDGEEALVVAKAEKPDLIISDVMMPKISGFEMLDIIRNTEELKHVKVIMLTALGQSDDQQRADRLGADKYLVKSQVTLEDIVKVAHDLLGDTGDAATAAPTTPAAEAVSSTETTTPQATPAPEPVAPEPVTPEPAAPATSEAPAPADLATETPATESSPTPITVTTDSEPVASSPTPEPATPETSTDSVTDTPIPSEPTTVADAPTNPEAPESTAQEEAEVEAKIEDFVAGANNNDSDSASDSTSSDNSTTSVSDDIAPAPTPELTVDAPKPDPDGTVVVAPTEEPKTEEEKPLEAEKPAELPVQKKVGGERVIEPIDSEPKKDLDALLAIEEAKESIPAPAVENAVVVDDKAGPVAPAPVPPPAPAPSGDKVDPNSIAL